MTFFILKDALLPYSTSLVILICHVLSFPIPFNSEASSWCICFIIGVFLVHSTYADWFLKVIWQTNLSGFTEITNTSRLFLVHFVFTFYYVFSYLTFSSSLPLSRSLIFLSFLSSVFVWKLYILYFSYCLSIILKF